VNVTTSFLIRYEFEVKLQLGDDGNLDEIFEKVLAMNSGKVETLDNLMSRCLLFYCRTLLINRKENI